MTSRISVDSTSISMSFFPKTASPSTVWPVVDRVPCKVASFIKSTTPRPQDIRDQRVYTWNQLPNARDHHRRANAARRTPWTHPLPRIPVSKIQSSRSLTFVPRRSRRSRYRDPEKCFTRFHIKGYKFQISNIVYKSQYRTLFKKRNILDVQRRNAKLRKTKYEST